MNCIKITILALCCITPYGLSARVSMDQILEAQRKTTDPYDLLTMINNTIQKETAGKPEAEQNAIAFATWKAVLSNPEIVKNFKDLNVVMRIMGLPNNYLKGLQQTGELYRVFSKTYAATKK